MHADVTGVPIDVGEFDNAPLLGCAVLAAVGAGLHTDVEAAAAKMVRVKERILPDPSKKEAYDRVFAVYDRLASGVRPLVHALGGMGIVDEDGAVGTEGAADGDPTDTPDTHMHT